MKKSLYDMDYKQIGRLPKFFNINYSKETPFNLDVWSGYTFQVKCLNDGFFLNIDTSTKFVQNTTVWQKIEELKRQHYSNAEIEKKLCPKYDDSSSDTSSNQGKIDSSRIVVITKYNSC